MVIHTQYLNPETKLALRRIFDIFEIGHDINEHGVTVLDATKAEAVYCDVLAPRQSVGLTNIAFVERVFTFIDHMLSDDEADADFVNAVRSAIPESTFAVGYDGNNMRTHVEGCQKMFLARRHNNTDPAPVRAIGADTSPSVGELWLLYDQPGNVIVELVEEVVYNEPDLPPKPVPTTRVDYLERTVNQLNSDAAKLAGRIDRQNKRYKRLQDDVTELIQKQAAEMEDVKQFFAERYSIVIERIEMLEDDADGEELENAKMYMARRCDVLADRVKVLENSDTLFPTGLAEWCRENEHRYKLVNIEKAVTEYNPVCVDKDLYDAPEAERPEQWEKGDVLISDIFRIVIFDHFTGETTFAANTIYPEVSDFNCAMVRNNNSVSDFKKAVSNIKKPSVDHVGRKAVVLNRGIEKLCRIDGFDGTMYKVRLHADDHFFYPKKLYLLPPF